MIDASQRSSFYFWPELTGAFMDGLKTKGLTGQACQEELVR